MTRAEFLAAALLFGLMIALKVTNMMRFRFDTDEPQHMHVIWGWARGFVQYRDLFDNHMPLFHITLAPIFGLIGDRPAILFWMRFILLPMYFVAAWATYRIGARIFSRRAGFWAVLLAGSYTGYHFSSFEIRTDNVWAPLWLLCLLVLIDGTMSVRRAAVAGLLLGLCFGISMKSTLLLLSILAGALGALSIGGRNRFRERQSLLLRCGLVFLVTTALIPLAILIFFLLKGIWTDFRYCVFEHNLLPHLDKKNSPSWFVVIFPIAFPFIIYVARLIARAAPDAQLAFRRTFLFVICGFYLSALYSFWTLITRQDFLPYYPLAFVFCSAALIAVCTNAKVRSWKMPHLLRSQFWPAYVAGLGLFLCVVTRPFWINGAKIEIDLLRDVLALTQPGEYVFDCKGETIFRQRCFRPILEPVTLERIQRKLMADDAPVRCVEKQVCLAAPNERTSWKARQFVTQNYLPIRGWTRVAGGYLRESSQAGVLEFDCVIPASYKIIDYDGEATGVLDGEPYVGARFLNAGKHSFRPAKENDAFAFLWARAVDLHYSPFDYRPPKPFKYRAY